MENQNEREHLKRGIRVKEADVPYVSNLKALKDIVEETKQALKGITEKTDQTLKYVTEQNERISQASKGIFEKIEKISQTLKDIDREMFSQVLKRGIEGDEMTAKRKREFLFARNTTLAPKCKKAKFLAKERPKGPVFESTNRPGNFEGLDPESSDDEDEGEGAATQSGINAAEGDEQPMPTQQFQDTSRSVTKLDGEMDEYIKQEE